MLLPIKLVAIFLIVLLECRRTLVSDTIKM